MIAWPIAGSLNLPRSRLTCGRRALDQGQRVDQLDRHPVLADLEVLERALGLRSPEPVGRDLHFTHRVGFDAELAVMAISPQSIRALQANLGYRVDRDASATAHSDLRHFPMQNRRKIRSRMSSVTTAPTTLPSSSTADRRSKATSSSPPPRASASEALRERVASHCQTAPAPRRVPAGRLSSVSPSRIARAMADRSASRPNPVAALVKRQIECHPPALAAGRRLIALGPDHEPAASCPEPIGKS